mmetsp:Transcript_21583/g.54504  ORF Transcript_21583/g.54504 Transcript_21583/m.54504 type:complete len:558 (-) Transcript_21583:482-2155(-)|eukprot:CAMPEP_0178996330 /NCGR_PEP_ID=MMETSP0795-20121207/8313_1 /TAXON_ID=88552 /ORGANISM="Amoebophrya sp., Strain Ameob2" /LENGTH=557 /DNA_ID=CAMNT_0020688717 /DNA_START=211 /DNA_END=1884 /DNA_ORIENTATION=-
MAPLEVDSRHPVVIIGGGLVGCLCAVLLQKTEKFQVTVYERYSDMRTIPHLGRSINLVMTRRGLKAAELLGIKEDLVNLSVKVVGRAMWQIDGKQYFQKYGREEDCNYSVSRYELNCFLLKEAERLGVEVLFGYKLKSVAFPKKEEDAEKGIKLVFMKTVSAEAQFQTTINLTEKPGSETSSSGAAGGDGGGEKPKEVEETVLLPPHVPVFGCDGGPSGLRYSMRDQGLLSFKEEILGQGYRELIFPKNPDREDGYCMEPSALHIWPRTTHMMMGLADRQGTFTGTLYVDNDQWPKTEDEAKAFFETHYPSAIKLLGGVESAAQQLLGKSPGILGTVRTSCFYHEGKALLLGDSAHAIVPFFGQGCNCGFEDCVILDELLREYVLPKRPGEEKQVTGNDWEKVFAKFHAVRKPSADAIANLALENFVEMRELVADPEFLKCKNVESTLERLLPTKFRSRYSLVCYGSAARGSGNLSYANAYDLGVTIREVVLEIVLSVEKQMGGEYRYKAAEEGDAESLEWQKKQEELVLEVGEGVVDAKIAPRLKQLDMDLGLIYA